MSNRARAIEEVSAAFSIPEEARDQLFSVIQDFASSLSGQSPPTSRPQWEDHKNSKTLPEFVAWAYATEREDGTLTKAALREDKKLYTDYFNWRRRHNLPTEWHWLRDLSTGAEKSYERFVRAGVKPTEVGIKDFTPSEQEIIRRWEAVRKRASRANQAR